MSISVLMCTYNGEKYIEEQLKSIYCQTVKPNEVLLIDDNSNDSTVNIISNFIKKYSLENSWFLKVNSKNVGYIQNFKNGIKQVNSDFIFFSDQDDIWEKQKIQCMMKYFNEYQDACVIGTDLIHFFPNGKEIIEGSLNGTVDKVQYNMLEDFIPHPAGCTMAVKKTYILKKMETYSPSWSHDEYFWRIATVDGCCYRVHKSFIRHRVSGTNVTSVPFKNVNDRIIQAERNSINYGQLLAYGQKKNISENQLMVINYYAQGNKWRFQYLKNPKAIYFIKLIKYRKIYLTRKQFFGDIYYTLIKNKQRGE